MTSQQKDKHRRAVQIERARDACLQALYFLGFSRKTDSDAVNESVESYAAFSAFQVKQLLLTVPSADLLGPPEDPVHQAWAAIVTQTNSGNPRVTVYPKTQKAADDLRRKIEAFLRISSGADRVGRLFRGQVPGFYLFALRRLAGLIATAVVAYLCLRVEIVSSLLWENGWSTIWVGLALAIPLLALHWPPPKDGPIHRWNLGRPPFVVGAQTIEPRNSVERWPYMKSTSSEDDPPRHLLNWIYRARFVRKIFVLLSWAAICLVIAAGFSDATRTVAVVLALLGSALLAADLLDEVEFASHLPIRLGALAILASGFLVAMTFDRRGVIALLVAVVAAAAYVYSRRFWPGAKYLAGTLTLGILIAVSGGNTHSKEAWKNGGEEWTRVPAEAWPKGDPSGRPVVVLAASGGGSRSAVYTGLTLEKLHDIPSVGENVQLISSVSGGSLANAAYTARRFRKDRLSGLSCALASDFVYPTLFGALVPSQSRGRSIENEWDSGEVDLRDLRLSDLAKAWLKAGSGSPSFPLPLFNSVTLSGHLVGISPLEASAFTDVQVREQAEGSDTNLYADLVDPTAVYYRSASYGLEQILSGFDPKLSQSVRASANFPFGFPLVRIPEPKPMVFSPPAIQHEEIRLTDGGALSNSGFLSLFRLLMNRSDALRQRGVLVVVVEASGMPEPDSGGNLNQLRGIIGDQNVIARAVHERMYDQLEQRFGDRIAIAQIDLPAERADNVLTTWALGPATLERLEAMFARRWDEEGDSIAAKFQALAAGQGLDEMIDRRRPPLD